ncbi:hypothetical protein MKS88_005413 [Plasmodium brasilianum]|uniref:Uncharacterized protein n=2 Tax=Plasmodium (Plasmodium) TaxID=418103 RepID=A0A1A8WEV0_PLAMA|nr:conserved Plasmodium protein, unknown function [Plasmodium malariae]KAI4834734.1 hypothetical protein MKS88_005413 [Plasmodium brasilianum]SBS90323.1 conserved Plasmodium protein, unknown function [Plasmodium malariae]SCP03290.1 conserved Plasmodium protein, unknown function [Plasmodium malariae]
MGGNYENNPVNNMNNVNVFPSSDDSDSEKEHMVSLRGFNICYKKKLEKLNTLKSIDNNKKIIKLVLDNVNLDPKLVMQKVVNLLKEQTTLYTIIEIDNNKYKIKYNEVTPDDHIIFPEQVHNITNCKYAFIGILKVSKFTKRCTFSEKSLQDWQNLPVDDF